MTLPPAVRSPSWNQFGSIAKQSSLGRAHFRLLQHQFLPVALHQFSLRWIQKSLPCRLPGPGPTLTAHRSAPRQSPSLLSHHLQRRRHLHRRLQLLHLGRSPLMTTLPIPVARHHHYRAFWTTTTTTIMMRKSARRTPARRRVPLARHSRAAAGVLPRKSPLQSPKRLILYSRLLVECSC